VSYDEYVPDVDLGDDHYLVFTSWAPDRDLNPQYDGIPDCPRIGAIVRHYRPDGALCEGSIYFDLEPWNQLFAGVPRWKVESWEPLTLSPSLLCACGDHGYVRNGRWVRA
jgi:hypothetical protein